MITCRKFLSDVYFVQQVIFTWYKNRVKVKFIKLVYLHISRVLDIFPLLFSAWYFIHWPQQNLYVLWPATIIYNTVTC